MAAQGACLLGGKGTSSPHGPAVAGGGTEFPSALQESSAAVTNLREG